MSLHSLELVGLEKEKPVVAHLLKNWAFSVNRSGKLFSRVGVDMALEQTINAETKSRLKGIIKFEDVSSAVNRWMITSNMRMEIQNRLREIAGMNTTESGNKEASHSRRKRDKKDLLELKKAIKQLINPFDEACNKDALFSLKTGKQAPETVEKFLLGFIDVGKKRRDDFSEKFSKSPECFEQPITKVKCISFAAETC